MWCLRESREIPSRVSSSDVVLCLRSCVLGSRTSRDGNGRTFPAET